MFLSAPIISLMILLKAMSQSEMPPRKTWADIQVGDCITTEELQKVSGVVEPNLYSSASCDAELPMSGQKLQFGFCDEVSEKCNFELKYKKHDKAGFFFPFPIPCQQSVVDLYLEHSQFESSSTEDFCSPDEPVEVFHQIEDFKTKKFSAGQGNLYLPNPFVVTTRQALLIDMDERLEVCERTSVKMEYLGFGKLKADVVIETCEEREPTFCRFAKLKSSENSKAEACVLVQEITDCLEE